MEIAENLDQFDFEYHLMKTMVVLMMSISAMKRIKIKNSVNYSSKHCANVLTQKKNQSGYEQWVMAVVLKQQPVIWLFR